MRKDSNDVGVDASNLWILDERLVFHDYLASDKTLKSMPVTDDASTNRPDILAEYSPRWGPLIEGSGATSLP
ncbi:hypothetical protein ACTXJ3_02960 [Brachybacterium paraconglomeratum]|uniref:hypothetical protein n=1 Tax=Brachybacterium paraconglomeratum TaxID=173362 RepID=UPI003FD2305A